MCVLYCREAKPHDNEDFFPTSFHYAMHPHPGPVREGEGEKIKAVILRPGYNNYG
jgi:hypothetical protein